MLNLTIVIKSNVLLKNSKARLLREYRKLFVFNFIYFNFLKKKTGVRLHYSFKLTKHLKSNMTTIMRSPFHYKTSKSILTQPSQNLKFQISFNCKNRTPLFTSSYIDSFMKHINNNTTLVVEKVIISNNN